MKKWIALLVALVITACTTMAFAEEIDLAGLSDDEIVALMGRVQEEIVARHIEGTATLAGGTYIAERIFLPGHMYLPALPPGMIGVM